jgi:Na+/glutamate symporter
VGRIYGGILGLLAFQTTIFRGWIHNADVQATLWTAWLALIAFATVGLVLGRIAGETVKQYVVSRMNAELATEEAKANEKANEKKKV